MAVAVDLGTRRVVGLDVARGLCVAAMILVNNQGSGAHAFWGMSHADWNGWSFADLVFPTFLFIVGASMAYAFGRGCSVPRVLRRAAVLFGLGLVLNGFPYGDLHELRVMGVLQRIGLAYLLAALLVMRVPVRTQVRVAAAALAGYWALLSVGGVGLVGGFDRAVLGATHVYKNGAYDPEGLLSTIPATVTVLAGYWAVVALAGRRRAVLGAACVVAGSVWGLVLPVNKRLWTPSFVVLTAGFGLLLLAACIHMHSGGWAQALGVNALVVYVASEEAGYVLDRFGWRPWLHQHVFSVGVGPRVGSLLYGLAFVGLWAIVCRAMWRRRIVVKI